MAADPACSTLRLSRRSDRCTVLGPGVRAVLWVQGCPFRCRGCVAPETLPFEGGSTVAVRALASELARLDDIEGITFSGGEPMAQAGALAMLIDELRVRRPELSFMSYSGYTLEQLRAGDAGQLAMLARLDLLVDGPYVRERHTDLKWRGSDNQVVHILSPRYEHLRATLDERGSSLELELTADGGVQWMGIPPPGFRRSFERSMLELGIELRRAAT